VKRHIKHFYGIFDLDNGELLSIRFRSKKKMMKNFTKNWIKANRCFYGEIKETK